MKSSTYRARYGWERFKKNKPALISLYVFILLFVIALLSDFIANKQPLYAKYGGKNYYPALQTFLNPSYTDSVFNSATNKYEELQFDITDWRSLKLEKVVWAPIPYSASEKDKYSMDYVSPLSEQNYKNADDKLVVSPYILRHHLGTNRIGEDVAAGLIHGTSIAFRVGFIAMAIAAFFGIMLGATAGFFGDHKLKLGKGPVVMTAVGLFFGYFYGFVVRNAILRNAFKTGMGESIFQVFLSLIITGLITFLFYKLGGLILRSSFFKKKIFIPVDIFISRFIEIFDSLPQLLLIITISALFVSKGLSLVIAIIGILSAPGIARLTRAEFLRIRSLDYIQSASALGYGNIRIIFRHILPNAIGPILVAIAFGVSSAIIAESSLSFLGIGVPADTVTWGSLISAARDDFNAWWMTLYPAIAIFITVTICNLIGEGLRDALSPTLKS